MRRAACLDRGSWLSATDEAGQQRLADPTDFVRIEIESALAQGKRVIPVLVGQATMPRVNDLPGEIKPLARRQAIRLTHERVNADAERLIEVLRNAIAHAKEERQRVETEAQRKAEEEERRRAEAETKRKAAEERQQAEAEANRKYLVSRNQAFATWQAQKEENYNYFDSYSQDEVVVLVVLFIFSASITFFIIFRWFKKM